jgi:hypothetical protein
MLEIVEKFENQQLKRRINNFFLFKIIEQSKVAPPSTDLVAQKHFIIFQNDAKIQDGALKIFEKWFFDFL